MKYCRFLLDDQPHYGTVEDRNGEAWITDLAHAPEEDLAFRLAHARAAVPALDFESLAFEPLLFFKPPSSLLAPGGVVRMPAASSRVDFEGELALVIGKRVTKFAAGADWRSLVRGYTLANDVTARDLQKKEAQWTRAKGFDTFCPVGPFVSDEIDPAAGVVIETRVNGELRQHGSTLDFIFGIPELLVYVSAAITLQPGDLLLTGTPAGVGPLAAGDRVDVSVPGLGVLANTFQPDAC